MGERGAEQPLSVSLVHLGSRLRAIRKAHHATHHEVTRATKISQSRLSKLENGKGGFPDFRDLERILEAIGATSEERDQLKRQYDLAQLDPSSYAYIKSEGIDVKQRQLRDIAEHCRLYRSYTRSVFSGVIQIPEYALGVFRSIGLDDDDANRAVQARTERSGILVDISRHFVFALDEAVLYTRHPADGSWAILAKQLDYVLRLSYRDNIDFRILPARGPAPPDISNPFLLIDRRYVSAELVTVEYVTTDVRELAAHERVFRQIEEYARAGDSARDLISRAITAASGRG